MNRNLVSLLLVLISLVMNAQNSTNGPEMADALRSNGKLYVVISVISLIFLSLVFFLVRLDRKVKKMEDKMNEK